VLVAVAVTAAIFDLRSRTIPNWLTAAGLVAGFAANVYVYGLRGFLVSLGGLGLAILIYFPLWLLKAMGGGDLKLMAALGAVLGASRWFQLFIYTAIIGAVIALFLLLIRGGLNRALRNVGQILQSLTRGQAPYKDNPDLDVGSSSAVTLPHGASIALGTFLLLWFVQQGL
jgi:prepilin peptidase CpaA